MRKTTKNERHPSSNPQRTLRGNKKNQPLKYPCQPNLGEFG